MPERTYGVHLGSETSESVSGFVVEENFLAVYETNKEHDSPETSRKIRSLLSQNPILEVTDFETVCQKMVAENKIRSLAAVYLSKNQVWTYTENGVIMLQREESLFQTSQEGKTLQGEFLSEDLFVLLTNSLKTAISPHLIILKQNSLTPSELVELFEEKLPKEQLGAVLVIKTATPPSFAFASPLPEASASSPLRPGLKNLFSSRYLKLGVLLVVLGLIFWKSFLVINSTLQKRRQVKLTNTITQLSAEFKKLEKAFPQNPTQTTQRIKELQKKVVELKKDNPNNLEEIDPLLEKLQKSTVSFGNPKVRAAKLFYDPALIDKKATINYFEMTDNYLVVLDTQNKQGYLINTSSKDHTDFSLAKLKRPTLATEYDEELFVYSPNEGVFESIEGTLKKVLSYEKDWGKIIDFKVFNGNLYLLSTTADEIFKFTPIEGGYGSKTSYFQPGQSLDLENARSLAIDFSVYILGDSLYKFTGGERAGFNLSNKLSFARMPKVFKTPANECLYLLDQENSRIVALNENGRIIQSLFNPKLKEGGFFGVYQDKKAIFVHQNKLYELDNL